MKDIEVGEVYEDEQGIEWLKVDEDNYALVIRYKMEPSKEIH